nr:hypothetical protein [Tanacetum cinerariifolium]
DPASTVLIPETFHEQTDDELTEAEIKQMEPDDQAIQTILLGLLEDIYAAIDSYETTQEIWLRVQHMMKGSDIRIQEKKAKLFHENQNGVTVIPGIAHQIGNGNVVVARVEGNTNRNNGNQIRCYNYRGLGHFARNCTVRPRRRDAAYLRSQLLIAQKEEAGIQLQVEEFDLMAAVADLDKIEEFNANYIFMANLQQPSTSGTQTDKAPVYDSDGSAEVQLHDNSYNDEIFNMFTQEEQYTELLEPIPESHEVPQNDINVIYEVSSVEHDGRAVEQHPANVEETRVLYDSLYNNVATEAEKVNSVNRKLRETNANLTTELARYKNQERCFEIRQEKYDKLERCYQQTAYQEQCLYKKINALHLSSGKQITTLNEEISNLSKQLSKKKSTVSSFQEEKKKLKSDFKMREDELLDKQIELENKIKELDNIVVSEQKDTTCETSANTKFAKQSILRIRPSSSRPKLYVVTPLPKSTTIPKVGETNALGMFRISPGMFRIDPRKTSRKDNFVPNKATKARVRTNPITISQSQVIIKKAVNSDSKGFSSIGVDITTKTRRPQPRSNTKNDRVPSVSKSSRIMNKEVKECLISENHDACVLNYVDGMNSRRKNQKANVSNIANQTKRKAQIWKPNNIGPKEMLASPKPSKPRMRLRWSPIGKKFDHKGKIIASSDSNSDNACTPNPREPTIKRFPNSTFFLGRLSKYFSGASTRVVPSI